MRILIDQNLPYRTAEYLRGKGHDAVHVGEVDPRMSDRRILEWAVREGRVCVTRDADFHAILSLSGMTKPSVVRLRIEDLSATETATLIDRVCELHTEPLGAGAMITLTRERVRVRRLPLEG